MEPETEDPPAARSSAPAPTPTTGEPKPKRRMKNRGFRSGVWSHFLRATDGQSGKCMHCDCLIKTKTGSTTGLLVHLKGVHKIDARTSLTDGKGKGLKLKVKSISELAATAEQESDIEDDDDDDDSNSNHVKGKGLGSSVLLVQPKVERQQESEEIDDDDDADDHYPAGDRLSVQLDDGSMHESYRRVDDEEITLFSLQNKSPRELKDLILHLQYKCQASEIECQRVKTKLALLRLSYCQSKLNSVDRVKNGRIMHLGRRPNSSRQSRSHASGDEDEDPDYMPGR